MNILRPSSQQLVKPERLLLGLTRVAGLREKKQIKPAEFLPECDEDVAALTIFEMSTKEAHQKTNNNLRESSTLQIIEY